MKKYSLLYTAFGFMVLLGLLNLVASVLYLYWTVFWFDNLTHALAGFAGGLVAIWFFFDSNLLYKRSPNIIESIVVAVLSVLVFALAWEVFEYVNDIAQASEGYVLDTLLDTTSGILGAILSGFFVRRKNLRSAE